VRSRGYTTFEDAIEDHTCSAPRPNNPGLNNLEGVLRLRMLGYSTGSPQAFDVGYSGSALTPISLALGSAASNNCILTEL